MKVHTEDKEDLWLYTKNNNTYLAFDRITLQHMNDYTLEARFYLRGDLVYSMLIEGELLPRGSLSITGLDGGVGVDITGVV